VASDSLPLDDDVRAALAAEQRRRARSAAQAIGTTFIGAGLIVASTSTTRVLPVVIAATGAGLAVASYRRRLGAIRGQLGDPSARFVAQSAPFDAVASALADLRTEAAATDALLRRLRARPGRRR
jgi:hypothetical protein